VRKALVRRSKEASITAGVPAKDRPTFRTETAISGAAFVCGKLAAFTGS
jgi:hypothetical protein